MVLEVIPVTGEIRQGSGDVEAHPRREYGAETEFVAWKSAVWGAPVVNVVGALERPRVAGLSEYLMVALSSGLRILESAVAGSGCASRQRDMDRPR